MNRSRVAGIGSAMALLLGLIQPTYSQVVTGTGATVNVSGCSPGGTAGRLLYDDGAGGCPDSTLSWNSGTNVLSPTVATTNLGTAAAPFQTFYARGDTTGAPNSQVPTISLLGDSGSELAALIGNLGVAGQIMQLTANDNFYAHMYLDTNTSSNLVGFFNQGGTYTTPTDLTAGDLAGQIIFNGYSSGYKNYGGVSAITATDTTKGIIRVSAAGKNWLFYNGIQTLPSVTFTGLPTSGDGSGNGSMAYCSDCDPTATLLTCTHVGGQTGAFAYRVNGTWKCIG